MKLVERLEQLPASAKWAIAVFAGACLPFAFAPFQQFWVAPVSIALLFTLWRKLSPGESFRIGLFYGLASFFSGIHWVYISVHDFGLAPIPVSLFLTGGLVSILAVYIALAGWAAARFFRGGAAAALLGAMPALWVLFEWCRGWLFSGFGWLSAGYSQTDSWLMGWAAVFGLHGMSWAVAVSAAPWACC